MGHLRRFPGQTRDISVTGVFFYADFSPEEHSDLHLLLTLPSEVTYTGDMPAVCRCRVVRVEQDPTTGKNGVAVEIESYEPFAEA
jgi:hypothetical protein